MPVLCPIKTDVKEQICEMKAKMNSHFRQKKCNNVPNVLIVSIITLRSLIAPSN